MLRWIASLLLLVVLTFGLGSVAVAGLEDLVKAYSTVLYIGGVNLGKVVVDYRFKVIFTYTGKSFYKRLGRNKALLPNYLKEGEDYLFNGIGKRYLFCAMLIVNRSGPFDPRLIKFVQGQAEYNLKLSDIIGKKEFFAPATFMTGDEVYGYFTVPKSRLLIKDPFYIFYGKYGTRMDLSKVIK